MYTRLLMSVVLIAMFSALSHSPNNQLHPKPT